ncbi:acyl-CoA dehydrogenase [Simplicispira suum]|uniref:Acyl-CoA dehydrogenase n=2 Tax=Simplicispira suum TaxID=2109915 RepID=A0A2S0N5R4_9BURK|nr:acyl-CoA dehydrogenase [Simplicispira suum]
MESEEQTAIQASVADWAKRELAPGANARDTEARFDPELYLRCGRDLGITRLPFSEEFGGAGAGMQETSVAIEEIARQDQSLAVTLMVSMAAGLMLVENGSVEQIERYLPGIVAGTALGAVAGTEPQAGSWTAGYTTRAVENATGWRIDGEKAFITNAGAPITSVVLVCAVTGGQPDKPQMTMFALPADAPGLVYGKPYDKLGWRSSETRPVFLDGVSAPATSIVGKVGDGRHLVHGAFKVGRILISAMAVGMAQGCLDHAIAYARERKAFGGSIADFQLVQKAIADIAIRVETSRLMVRKSAWMRDEGQLDDGFLSMTKYYSTEAASQCADLAIQVHGGYGFMNECAPTRFWRDGRVLRIGDGTSEIQIGLIARALGLTSLPRAVKT